MADSGRHANHDRDVIGFTDPIGFLGQVDAFLRIGRLEHGDFGKFGIIPVVLFILRRVHPWVIGRHEGKAAVDGQIGKSEQRIRSNVDTDHLHSRKRADARHRSTDGRFHGDFFIRRPFGIHTIIFRDILQDFRTRRPGISRSKGNVGFI